MRVLSIYLRIASSFSAILATLKLRVLSIIKHAIRKIEKRHKKLRVLSIYLRIAYIALLA